MAKKPVILEDYRAEMDDEIEELIERNRRIDELDPMYIEGYTEITKANDIAKANDLVWAQQYEKTNITKQSVYDSIGAQPQELKLHFKAIRVVGMDGTHNANVSRDIAEYQRWGYRPALYPQDFTPNGWGKPLGYNVQSDGTLRRDDLQLFVVAGRAERARLSENDRRTAEAENPQRKTDEATGAEISAEVRERRTEQHTT